MLKGLTILHKSIWREAKADGRCATCGREILLLAFQLFRRFKIGADKWRTLPVNPPLRVCCACFDEMES